MRFEFNDDSQKICNSNDVANYGIQCDICSNKVLSVSNINGRRYCAGCYYKTFMKDNQKAEIDQLKQQLAEKDNRIAKLEKENGYILFEDGYDKDGKEVHRQVYKTYNQAFNEQVLEAKKLRRQLKEKDKEIAHLKDAVNMCQSIKRYDIGEMLIENAKLKQNQTQLAIQELEKVKIMAGDLLEKFCSSWEYHQKYMRGHRHIEYYDLIQGIDNQIKELRGE